MNNLLIFENEKRLLLTALSLKYSEFSLDSISKIAGTLDDYLKAFAHKSLIQHSKAILSLEVANDSVFLIDDNSNFYELNFSEDIDNKDLLLIVISVRGNTRHYTLDNFDFSLSECFGKYLSFNITYPKKLKIKKQDTQELITTIFETGYNWFYEKTIELAKQEENKLGYQLYEFLKTIIHSKELRNNLWFASITGGYGFRLLNESVARESFKLIHKNIKQFEKSTNLFVAELLNTKLPEDQLLMINAIKVKSSIDANLKNASYNKTDSLYAATLKCLYGQNQFTVYPVYENDKFCVVALFDTKNKNQLVPILLRHKTEIDEICKKSIGGIRALLGKLKVGAKGLLTMIWEGIELKPEIFGLGFDFKKLINHFTKQQPKKPD